MTIVLTFTNAWGKQEEAKFEDDELKIALLKKQITDIDLSPLIDCSSLQTLSLSFNLLRTIELSPLASCTNLQELRLRSNRLQSIELSPLASCTNLLRLSLGLNQLQIMNLTPLSACTRLQILDLNDNQLRAIELSPLASCTNLQELDLDRNQFRAIDLSPLAACRRLERLGLCANQLQSVDLNPLAACTSLQSLALSSNPFQSIDLSPLASCASMRIFWLHDNPLQSVDLSVIATFANLLFLELDNNPPSDGEDTKYSWLKIPSSWSHIPIAYRRPTGLNSWSFLHWVAEHFGTDHRVQQDILCAMGLKDYGFIDDYLSDLFLSIPAGTPIDKAREQVRERLLEKIMQAANQKRETTGLNTEEILNQHLEAAATIHEIAKLRQKEIQQVVVGVSNNEADLRELWLTSYGYEVLTALSMHLTTDLKGLERIRSTFSEMGLELKTGKTARSEVKMSDELKEAIWWIAQNRGRQWNEIEG
jgi:hypothetical protein